MEGLTGLFSGGGEKVELHPLEVWDDGSPSAVWEALSTTYDAERLPPSARASLKEAFLSAVEPLRLPDGTLPCRWGMRQLTAVSRG